MQSIGAAWLYPFILAAGALQAWGPPMNGALRQVLGNPWLASTVSFLPIVALLGVLLLCLPPLPTVEGVTTMRCGRRWAGSRGRWRWWPGCCSWTRWAPASSPG